VGKLLSQEFPGRDGLLRQFGSAEVRRIDRDGSLEIRVSSGAVRADVARRIPIEAELEDLDGVRMHVLLHAPDGVLSELEIYREDSQPVQRDLEPGHMSLLVL
jgi:hypothetical protein